MYDQVLYFLVNSNPTLATGLLVNWSVSKGSFSPVSVRWGRWKGLPLPAGRLESAFACGLSGDCALPYLRPSVSWTGCKWTVFGFFTALRPKSAVEVLSSIFEWP